MRVYYYTSAENAIDDIKNSHIKVSLLDGVNDPNEWVPTVLDDKDNPMSIDAVRAEVLSSPNIEWGFISFCKSWDILPMWGIYGDRFRGAVLEFEVAEDLLTKVEYTPERAVCKGTVPNSPSRDDFKDMIRRKSTDWMFEQEVRYVVQLLPLNCELSGKHYFVRFGKLQKKPRLTLASVRCGPLMNNQDYGKVRFLLGQDKAVRLIKMKFSERTFTLNEDSIS